MAGRYRHGSPFVLGLGGSTDAVPPTTDGRTKSGAQAPESAPLKVPKKGRSSVYIGVGVAIIVVMVVLAYILTGGFHHAGGSSGTQGRVLVPFGSSYSLPSGQFDGLTFTINSTSIIQGELNSSRGVDLYVMTPTEFETLVRTLNVSGYEWASGEVADQSIYQVDITVTPGTWVLAFTPPNQYIPTGVGFYSDLTLTPA